MSFGRRRLVEVVIMFGSLLVPVLAAASPGAVATPYEDWQGGVIRSDRWQGGEDFGLQEVDREVTAGNLQLRARLQGTAASNAGSTNAAQFLNVTNPAAVKGIEASFTVTNLGMNVCAANNAGLVTRSRPARLLMEKFNDGTQSVAGNRVGDYLAIVEVFRNGSSTDPAGVLRVAGQLIRCEDATCGTSTTVALDTLEGTVTVGQPFTLRLKWDQPNHQFLFGLDGSVDVALPYSANDAAPANSQFVNMHMRQDAANCTAGAVALDATTLVGTVQTLVATPTAYDFNGDGKADILWRHSSGIVAQWLMNGPNVVGAGLPGEVPPDWAIVGRGDFNGDGKADILWRNTSSGGVVMWLMDGGTVLGNLVLGAVPVDWIIAEVGDLNGDGKADILWRNTSSGVVALWLMNGGTVVSNLVLGTVPVDWTIAKVGDFNGDGTADILWRNSSSGVVAMWLMNGGTVLSGLGLGAVPTSWQTQ